MQPKYDYVIHYNPEAQCPWAVLRKDAMFITPNIPVYECVKQFVSHVNAADYIVSQRKLDAK